MNLIGELLSRDLSQDIEEIIKVDQFDEHTVYTEITEYVATDRIKDHYLEILRAMAEAPAEPHEGVGIWISGFFGSGKSSFAKNLGYVLANPSVLGKSYSELFKVQLDDNRISEYVDFINTKIPIEVIMFDVSKASEVKKGDEKIAEIVYRALLSKLDYAMDYDISDLEIELEEEGNLDRFISLCPEVNGIEWSRARKGAKKINYASAILNRMDPEHFPKPDTWALSHPRNTLTVEDVVERSFDLMEKRRPGKALVLIIDEVGQYVARSADRIEDLRALVEQFGKVSKNRLKAKKAVAPVWIAVTSQEKLDEVVAAIDSKRVDLAKLQDRFKYRIDLAPSDIREVATRRVLAKKEDAIPLLEKMYDESQGQLNLALRLERTAKKSEVKKGDFVQCYPYPPHFVEISIDIMSGIRLQPGADRHLGGSNRTIIKQAQQMLVNERTKLAKKPVGTLVTIDKIFDIVEGNLSTEKRKDLADIFDQFGGDGSMASRVSKVVCLLEFIRDLPRTEANIAACIVDAIGEQAPLAEVRDALKCLQEAKFVRETEEGWKLQTAQEKNWETERRSLEPRPRDRNELLKSTLGDIFNEPVLKSYRFQKLKTFNIGLSFNGSQISDGHVSLSLFASEDGDSFEKRLEEIRNESRSEGHKNEIYFLFSLNPEIDDLVADLYSSKKMVEKYDQLRGQNRITREEAASLEDEKKEVMRKQSRLRDLVRSALLGGSFIFRGISRDGSDLGKSLESIIKKALDEVILDLYPRLPIWAKPLKGKEASEILKAANLNGLSPIFYNGEQGMELVVKDGQKYVPNSNAEIVQEVLQHLNREHSYGNRDTRSGKALAAHFGGIGYGGDQDMLRLVLAVLFRAGMIEVSHSGQKFDSYQDPVSHDALMNNSTFKTALFTPAKIIPMVELAKAAKSYEDLSGDMVDVDKNSIASALKGFVEREIRDLVSIEAKARANDLPVLVQIDEIKRTLTEISKGETDECVTILMDEGERLKRDRDTIRKIREITDEGSLRAIRQARLASRDTWPVLKARAESGRFEVSGLEEKADRLKRLLEVEEIYDHLAEIGEISSEISSRYAEVYDELHSKRREAFGSAIETVKGRVQHSGIDEREIDQALRELAKRGCEGPDLRTGGLLCERCKATIPQMESDLAALSSLETEALERVERVERLMRERARAESKEKTTTSDGPEPEKQVVRVRLSEFFSQPLSSREAVERSVQRLKSRLLELLDENVEIVLE